MFKDRAVFWLALLGAIGPSKTFINDPYYLRCLSEGIACHQKAICQLDIMTNSFYCQCLPGYTGDGINYCQEPRVKVTVFNESACTAGTRKQVCLLKKMPGENTTLRVSVKGSYKHDQIKWYKFYSSEGPHFHRHKDFGYIRAIVYGYISGVPVKVMVAQQLFLLKKDLSKVCQGTRSEDNCKCNPGFEGNGIHCVDKDECVEGMPLVCLPQATCINTYGSYICQCPEGFEGDGLYSCIDIDECATEASHCNPKAICVNTLGSYICVCQSGFIERGNHCKERSTWTPWSPWSICTVSCVRQNQMRIRLCTHPESGMRCEGPSAQLKPCPVKNSCPVDSLWSPWTAWTPCPLSCGLAMVSRFRRCISPSPGHSGKNCVGSAYEEGSCGFPEEFCKYLSQP
ncbi:adhesion G protein-coupled receptor E1-like isoform X1 [Rhinatrema bivittatum]|uniref:adhesion G protein-coupled receptor E1-like isoform X1 n=1 Tax=Rhinatrema bivittatum TaxID=194408 RepID=UPI00112B8A1B|nr:adhesion G protein-coupled receptor E1-like isoform X1 [Rhinatrema bivittatum]